MPAAIGLEALVPVCLSVHFPRKSVVTTFLSLSSGLVDPELKVVTKDDEQGSEYQGMLPFSETLLTLNV